MNAVILFSHGSTLCGAGDALEAHAERLRKQYPLVEVGFMNYSTPTFEEALAKVAGLGATTITIVPFFLVPGYFVTKSLPDRVDSVRSAYPDLTFTITPPLGADELLADSVIDAALNPLADSMWREGLNTAARQCRYISDCPIYGTAQCPPTYALVKEKSNG